jgi:hypothetical protein
MASIGWDTQTRRMAAVMVPALVFAATLGAQTRSGIRFGAAFPIFSPQAVELNGPDGAPQYRLSVDRIGPGLNGGMFFQMQFGAIVIQPEVYYTWSTVDYAVDTLYLTGAGTADVRETYRGIGIPLLIFAKTGVFRIGGGPLALLALNNDEVLSDYAGIEESFDRLSWGLQGGVGFDFWKLHVELRYVTRFSDFGEHIAYNGQPVDFGAREQRIHAALGFSF